jgi:hypothetical protein
METQANAKFELVIFARTYHEKVYEVESYCNKRNGTFIVLPDGQETNVPAPYHMELRVKFGWFLSDENQAYEDDIIVGRVPIPDTSRGTAEQIFVLLLRNYQELQFQVRDERWDLHPGYYIMKMVVTAFIMGAEWRSKNPEALIPRRDEELGSNEFDLCY